MSKLQEAFDNLQKEITSAATERIGHVGSVLSDALDKVGMYVNKVVADEKQPADSPVGKRVPGIPMKHVLKTDPATFCASVDGKKTYEIRLNDRDYQVGDLLQLRETVRSGADMKLLRLPVEYTGRRHTERISHILSGYGLQEGWVILSYDSEFGNEEKMVETADVDAWKLRAAVWLRAKAEEQQKINNAHPAHVAAYFSWTNRLKVWLDLAEELEGRAPWPFANPDDHAMPDELNNLYNALRAYLAQEAIPMHEWLNFNVDFRRHSQGAGGSVTFSNLRVLSPVVKVEPKR